MTDLKKRPIRTKWLAIRCIIIGLLLVLVSLLYPFQQSISQFKKNIKSNNINSMIKNIDANEPVRACFVVLVRNSELEGIKSTIRQIEERFNKKFNYPYVFLNDDYFTDDFVEETSALTSAQTNYGKVDQQVIKKRECESEREERYKIK